MKNIIIKALIIYLLMLSTSVLADEKLTGTWQGKLSVQGTQLRLVFNITTDENHNLKATMDSPDQGAKGLPVSEVIVTGDSIFLQVPFVGGYYEGILSEKELKITGHWHQSGMSFPVDLYKTDKTEAVNRPQTPREPFNYKVEEVIFTNEIDKIKLAGTLTIPAGNGEFPFVVLVSGSGPQDRDETILYHKPFLVLADHLTKNGIGVLRYDDRGTAYSEGTFADATTRDFVKDALAGINYLLRRDDLPISKLGIIGHSEGGLIAPMAAAANTDIDFIVMLAGPSLQGDELLSLQSGLISKAAGAPEEMIEQDAEFSEKVYLILKNEEDLSVMKKKITELFNEYFDKLTPDEKKKAGDMSKLLAQSLKAFLSPWFREFIRYDPKPVLEKTTIPLLALYGEKDLQVPPKENIKRLESALRSAGNNNYKIIELPNLNHLFQHAETGSPMEYGAIEETFAPEALDIIKNWIISINEQI